MSWENLFSPIILERGYDYYVHRYVTLIKRTESDIRAIVSGSDDYSVDIIFNGDCIEEMNCTCPYADDGNRCKHMAAVLFAIEGVDGEGSNTGLYEDVQEGKHISDSAKIKNIVANMESDEVRKRLISILCNDEVLMTGFLAKFDQSKENITRYIIKKRRVAQDILNQCADRHGFVDWQNASEFTSRLIGEVISELYDFASEDIEEAKAAFEISLFVYNLFANTAIDDSGGETQYFADECLKLWETILENACDNDFAKYMLDEFNAECARIGFGEYLSEMIDDFVSNHFSTAEFANTRLEAT